MSVRVIVATAAIGLAGSGAFADVILTPVGDPDWGGSWTQRFQALGDTAFDIFGIKMVSPGDSFKETTLSAFDLDPGTSGNQPGGWSQAYANHPVTPTLAIAEGSSTDYLEFDLQFAGDMGDDLDFTIVFYDGDTLWGSFLAEWDGEGELWSISAGSWDPGRDWLEDMILNGPIVPLPAPMALAGIGLLGVVLGRRRISRIVGT